MPLYTQNHRKYSTCLFAHVLICIEVGLEETSEVTLSTSRFDQLPQTRS